MRRLITIIALVVAPKMAAASVVVPLAEPELVAKADTIFFGTVVNTRALQSPTGFVSTRIEVQVYRGIKGAQSGDVVYVDVPGGDLGNGVGVAVSGSPRPVIGDMIFCFGERHGDAFRPLGMSFGWLAVKQSAAGDLRVFRQLEGLHLEAKPGTTADLSTFVVDGEKLDDFANRIEQRVRALPTPPASAPMREVKP
jgi:hypothetical protein